MSRKKKIMFFVNSLIGTTVLGILALGGTYCFPTESTIIRIAQASEVNDVRYIPFPSEFKKYEVYPWEMIKLADFNKSYMSVLGERTKEKWLTSLSGPSSLSEMVTTAKGRFVQIHSCQQHHCDTHFIVVLYEPISGQCWGLLEEDERIVWLGKPDEEMKYILRRTEKLIWANEPKGGTH